VSNRAPDIRGPGLLANQKLKRILPSSRSKKISTKITAGWPRGNQPEYESSKQWVKRSVTAGGKLTVPVDYLISLSAVHNKQNKFDELV
jgi:hypothetical protein